jgi:hypothetical protein
MKNLKNHEKFNISYLVFNKTLKIRYLISELVAILKFRFFHGIIGHIWTKSSKNVILDRVGTILSHMAAAILDFQFWLVVILQEDFEAVISRLLG